MKIGNKVICINSGLEGVIISDFGHILLVDFGIRGLIRRKRTSLKLKGKS